MGRWSKGTQKTEQFREGLCESEGRGWLMGPASGLETWTRESFYHFHRRLWANKTTQVLFPPLPASLGFQNFQPAPVTLVQGHMAVIQGSQTKWKWLCALCSPPALRNFPSRGRVQDPTSSLSLLNHPQGLEKFGGARWVHSRPRLHLCPRRRNALENLILQIPGSKWRDLITLLGAS